MSESHLSSTEGTTLRQAVEEVAAEWERNGWLRKFVKNGQEYWQMTPLGLEERRRERVAQATASGS
jgi:hypothetical protein